jgi:hypothetical protein
LSSCPHPVTRDRHGAKGPDGKYTVKFGPLFYATDQIFEALAGTLKSAKRYNVVDYPGDVLMQRAHDNVSVILLKETHDGSPFLLFVLCLKLMQVLR